MEKKILETSLVKVTNDLEKEYLCESIFVVDITGQDNADGSVYLRHYLSGLYFAGLHRPLVPKEERMKSFLVPLLPPKKKQFPPFRLEVREGNKKVGSMSFE